MPDLGEWKDSRVRQGAGEKMWCVGMTFERLGPKGLDYRPCRYGASRLLFRGPKQDLREPHVLFLGGTATYGKFLRDPFPSLVAKETGIPAVNLGVVNAGADLYLSDSSFMDLTRGAVVTVLKVLGAQNLSNRYYTVHPRRNDRFVQASALLKTIYRDVDFTAFHYTRHMLCHLEHLSPERFAILVAELKEAWVARMGDLIAAIDGPVVLNWFSTRPMSVDVSCRMPMAEQGDPLFVDGEMIAQLRGMVAEVVETVPAAEAGTEGMVFSQMEAAAARTQFNARAHAENAANLAAALHRLVPEPGEEQERPRRRADDIPQK